MPISALLLAATIAAAPASGTPARAAVLESIFVYRPPADVAAADERTGGPALEVLLTAPAKVGDRFFVVLPREKRLLGAVLEKTVENHADYPGPIGHLFPEEQSTTWTALRAGKFGPALLVRADTAPPLDRFGLVSNETPGRARYYTGRMATLLSGTVPSKLLAVRGFTSPDGTRWELAVATPRDVAKREFGVWQAGAIFEREGERRLLLAETGLSDVVSVSDLDADGMLEVVVQLGPSFAVRLFDGNRFLAHGRVLEVWEP